MDLQSKIEGKGFVVLAEMDPPKGTDISRMVDNALRVRNRVDAFLVPEMGNAVMRMSALGCAMLLETKGLRTVMQVCCRDRNRLALQADLLAAGAGGIRAVMAVEGEAPSFGDHHEARAVYDLDLPGLFQAIAALARGKDMAGVDLAGAPVFLVGAAANAAARGTVLDAEIAAMQRKIEAGVRFFVLPPVFDLEAVAPFLSKAQGLGACLIPTVLLVKSLGMIRYIARHMNHVAVPDSLVARIQKAPDKVQACIGIAAEVLSQIKTAGLGGVLLSTVGWEERLSEILACAER